MVIDAQNEIVLPDVRMTIGRARLLFFAKAIGERAAVYTDPVVAGRAGYPDLPAPPTFLFSVELECRDPFAWLSAVKVDPRRVLHGKQGFHYNRMVHAGDTVVARPRIVSFQPKTDSMDVLVKETQIVVVDGQLAATLRSTFLIVKGTR